MNSPLSAIKAPGLRFETSHLASVTDHRFPIHDPTRFWIIDCGKVDLYIAKAVKGRPMGAYHHIMRLSEGRAFFGILPEDENDIALIASPSPGTTLISDSLVRFRAAALAQSTDGDLVYLLEDWIHNLSEAAARGIVPKDFVTLAPGEKLKIADRAKIVLPGTKLVWIRQVAGISPILTTGEMTIQSDLYPVSKLGWVETQPGSEIQGYDSYAFLRHDCALEILKKFHSDQHPMALIPSGPHRYRLHDPDANGSAPFASEIAESLNPVAYNFYRPLPSKALSARDLLAFGLLGAWSDLLMIVLMGIATGAFAVVTPFATGIIFDSLIPGARRTELWLTCGFLMVASVAANLFSLSRNFTVLRLQGKLGASMQAAVWDRLLRLPVSFFRDYATGDLAVRSMGISEIRRILTGATLDAILSGIFSVFSFSLLFYYSTQLALIGTGLSFIALVVTVLGGYWGLVRIRQAWSQSSLISGTVLEFITGIAKFRVAGTEKRAFAMWAREFAKQKKTDYSTRRIGTLLATFNSVYLVLSLVVIFWYNATFLRLGDSTLSTGQFLAFVAAFSQFMSAVLNLGAAAVSALSIVPIYELAAPILRTLPETNIVRAAPRELVGGVEANHLVFRYRPNAPPVLCDLSFSAAPGEYIAFVGPSGCGKSTLFRLLLGFETAESGAVYYDGQDLAGLDTQAVRQQIGVVLQTSALISGSILDNIRGATSLTVEAAWEAARLAGLEDDIRAMPMGMYTMINEGGEGLSGGQRQRILIARAIIRRPNILMMDEATSALDNRTQAIVSESLRSLKSTRIVIAHRLSTIIDADSIFVMDRGKIVQSGTYHELMKEHGLFRDLAGRQLA